jgi:hypothetical protein
MPDLSILNTLIAMVIVILVLSLIVQSLQTLVKKFFKLKSRTLFNSLVDLFETITQRPDGTTASAAAGGDSQQKRLAKEVIDKFAEMGRKTLILGRPMLDSIAKGDLLKVLTRVQANNLLPGAVDKFQKALNTVNALDEELNRIKGASLEGDASAKFAALQAQVTPLIDDIRALVLGDGSINPKVLLGDLYKLRQVKVADVLGILGEIQNKVEGDLGEAEKAKDEARVGALRLASDGLRNVALHITNLGKAFDAAFAPLREQLQQAEVWYDTVMQGFEERYTRHMRTVALVISVIVVMILNANFFSIYRALAADPVKTAALAEQTGSILEQSRRVTGGQDGATATPTPAASASPAPTPAAAPVTVEDLKRQGQEVSELVGTYKSFGIEPLTWQQFYNGITFNAPAGDIFETVIGWAIMVMLLSVGAPFWQDTLESLFGLKNLLRQKSDTKNVEGQKGGQPKP